jgi:hypothetical protein
MVRNKQRFIFGLITAATAWCALALQQYILIDNTPGNGMTILQAIARFLLFFTVLTNLMIAVGVTISLLSPPSAAGRFFSKTSVMTATAVYIFTVAVVYNTILRGIVQLDGRDRIADELLHVVVPVLYLCYWYLFVPRQPLRWILALYWCWYPGLYVVYALIRGRIEDFYAYPFINLQELGTNRVLLNSGGMLVLFVTASLLFITAINRLSRRRA